MPSRSPRPDRADPRYLRPGLLWQAYERSEECVLLIDEIDKAPRDFPNDLLQEFSDQAFAHPFGKTPVENQGPPPILIITSNGERCLPDPFLRRCVVCHLVLEDALLDRILDAWESAFAPPPKGPGTAAAGGLLPGVRPAARAAFDALRVALKQGRPPGIAELLMWLNALAELRVPAERIDPKDLANLPFIHCLVKEQDDYQLLGAPARR